MQNFWENSGWEKEDRHLRGLSAAPFRRHLPEIRFDPGLHFIRGPRQIGKSTLLKSVLKNACDDPDVTPKQVFFASCESIQNHKELSILLQSVEQRRVILLDEVSFVEEWWRAVKHFLDTSTRRHCVVLTGSHAHDLKKGADLMPGRWAPRGEIYLLPMLFPEWKAMRAQAGWAESTNDLELYFRVGGFPTALAESGPQGNPPLESEKIYWNWLRGDVTKLGKSETSLREVLGQIATTLTTPVSLQTLAAKTQMGSHNTAQSYVEILSDCFALRTLFAIDPDTGAFRFRKEKKFYFSDPMLYWVALRVAGLKAPKDWTARIAEQVATIWILRSLSSRDEMAVPRVGYLSTQKNGEIDLFHPGRWALEVKCSPYANNLSRAFVNSLVPWKRVWTQETFGQEFPPMEC